MATVDLSSRFCHARSASSRDLPEKVRETSLWAGPVKGICWCTLLLLLPQASLAAGGDAALGRDKAAGCSNCHGVQGIAPAPNFPNLAGQKEAYLVKALRAYRDGTRHDPIMRGMVAPLSDDDIRNLAAYFAGLPRK